MIILKQQINRNLLSAQSAKNKMSLIAIGERNKNIIQSQDK
jgi:hypothetical protein